MLALFAVAQPGFAQTALTTAEAPAPSASSSGASTQQPAASSSEPALRRWLEFQTLSVNARYRYLDSNRTGSSHDPQYKESVRARFLVDRQRRLSVNLGFFSGTQFIGTFDNLGLGINDGNYHSHYIKQLFVAAVPITGVELQYGGIYVIRGENTEITTYDDDGYIVGERLSVRRPKQLLFDEISVTRGLLGPTGLPNLFDRWYGLNHPNYTQVLLSKRLTSSLAVSADYTTVGGSDTLHAAAIYRLDSSRPVSSIRYEQYRRSSPDTAAGFAVTAEAHPVHRIRFSGGYTTVDERYDANGSRAKLNSERMQRGRRFFVTANVPIVGALSSVVFFTKALPAPYELTNRTRVDVMFQYDLLSVLRRSGRI